VVLQGQQIKILIIHLRLIFTSARMLSNHLFLNLFCSILEEFLIRFQFTFVLTADAVYIKNHAGG